MGEKTEVGNPEANQVLRDATVVMDEAKRQLAAQGREIERLTAQRDGHQANSRELLDRLNEVDGNRKRERQRADELQDAALIAENALSAIWAAIGDALLSGKGIDRQYSKGVAANVREAEKALRHAIGPATQTPHYATAMALLRRDLAAANERIAALEEAVRWALGEEGRFHPPSYVDVKKSPGRYWWRSKLRALAEMVYDGEKGHSVARAAIAPTKTEIRAAVDKAGLAEE